MAVIESGQVYFVRVDYIGRPVFATNAAGVKVWTVAYDPFGNVTASSGAGTNIRFPGQWFQSESGLHQNWMRDYDPTTGRYLQGDPLGLVDGASVYGYVRQNPGRWVDPRGECFGPLIALAPACAGAAVGAATFLFYEYVFDDGCWKWSELAAAAVTGAAFGIITGRLGGIAAGAGIGATDDIVSGAFGPASVGAGQLVRNVQSGGRILKRGTVEALNDALGMSKGPKDWGRALEKLKSESGLRNDHHGTIRSNGDYVND